MKITILGKGNMGQAIGKNLAMGNEVEYFGSHDVVPSFGDLVVLAVHIQLWLILLTNIGQN